MNTEILLEAIKECLKNCNQGGAYIMKQFMRDIETYKFEEKDIEIIMMSPQRLASHIILAYESLRLATNEEAAREYKCLRYQINHKDSFPFGDLRYCGTIAIESPNYLVMKFMERVREKCINTQKRMDDSRDKWERNDWETGLNKGLWEKFFAELKILLEAPEHSIWMAYMTFVSTVWRNGFYDFVCKKLAHTDSVDIPLERTVVTIIDSYRCGVIFSANNEELRGRDRQTSGVMFLKGEFEDPSGHLGNFHICGVDFPTALSLIYGAINAWPKVKQELNF